MKKLIQSTSFLAILACLLWSTAFTGIKIGLEYTPPIQFAGIRFMLSGLLIMPLVGKFAPFIDAIRKNGWYILLIAFFQTFILYALFYKGISMLPGSITAITIGAQPLFIALMAHFYIRNDRLTFKKVLLISLGISGVALIALRKGFTGHDATTQLIGIALLILSNISSGIANLLVHQSTRKISSVVLSSLQLFLGGVGLMILSHFIEPFKGFIFPLPYYLALGWLSMLSAVSFTLWFILLKRPGIKVSELNVWKFIIPVFGAIFSWMILPLESPDIISITGMAIIAISLILYYMGDFKKKTT